MKASLREVRHILKIVIAEAFPFQPEPEAGPTRVLEITPDMVSDIFEEGNITHKLADVPIFVPFTLRKAFVGGSELAIAAKAFLFQPKDAAAVLKKGEQRFQRVEPKPPKQVKGQPKPPRRPARQPEDVPDDAIILRMAESPKGAKSADEAFFDKITASIVRQFRTYQIEEVMPIESRSSMAIDLAIRVAHGLGVPYTRELTKMSNPTTLDWDHEVFDAWKLKNAPAAAAKLGRDVDTYILDTYNILVTTKQRLQDKLAKGGTISIAEDIHHQIRKFWNLYDIQDANAYVSGTGKPKRILVIDDNAASGASFIHANKALRGAGVEPFFAAGFFFDTNKR